MAIERDNPYGTFNFLVDIGTGDTQSIKAGFQEVSGMNIEAVSYTHLRAHETVLDLVCRLLLEKKHTHINKN